MKTRLKTKKVNTKKITKQPIKIQQQDLITVILLCDNPGYRMKSYGPISLVPIGSKKLIDIQIESIKAIFPRCEIIVCLGFDCEKVCRYVRSKYSENIRIVENQLFATTNSCEALRLCLNNTNNNKILICDGNLLFSKHTMSMVDTNKPCALIEQDPSETLEIGVNVSKNVAYFFSFGAKYIWSEILFLTGEDIIESLRKILSNTNNKTRFVFEVLNELINMKYEIKTISNKKSIHKINNIKTYHSIKDFTI
jgi:NDP-sugar pyrophosphorylase family protein